MIFQDPVACLNPVISVGEQVKDVLRRHQPQKHRELRAHVLTLMKQVKLQHPEIVYEKYPHELSGGIAQRILLAMALSCEPAVLIADEPTTALDLTTQAGIIQLLLQLQKDRCFAMLFISHDIRVVQHVADDILVLHQGEIVETGMTVQVVENPQEQYTKSLLDESRLAQ
jgi:peptide/nickel transport system ATP-binding protein